MFDWMNQRNRLDSRLTIDDIINRSDIDLEAFVEWMGGLSQEELTWYEGRYVEVFLSL